MTNVVASAQQYREVKRKAAVGERIKIVAADGGGYVNGDELIVVEASWPRIGSVDATLNGVREHVWFREYVVLEPVAPSPLSADPLYAAFRQFVADNADELRKLLPELEAPGISVGGIVDAPFTVADSGAVVAHKAKLTRAQVIAKATADVAELTDKMRSHARQADGNYTSRNRVSQPEFHVNRTKRVVTVLVREQPNGEMREKGFAKCSPADVFHAEIGKAIALRKALGLTVPTEYMDAPQPDEPRVGAVVADDLGNGVVTEIRPKGYEEHSRGLLVNGGPGNGGFWTYIRGECACTILDDTDVDYGAVSPKGVAA